MGRRISSKRDGGDIAKLGRSGEFGSVGADIGRLPMLADDG